MGNNVQGQGVQDWTTVFDPTSWFGKPITEQMTEKSPEQKAKEAALLQQSGAAGRFADVGEQGYGAMTAESLAAREAMRRRASGQDSLSSEQLRQGLQQNLAAQRSMAAGASANNSAMAARMAANNSARLGYGMSGQAATAGIQERSEAEKALMNAIMQQRGQDIGVALGSRQNAIGGLKETEPNKSWMENWAAPVGGALGAVFASDKRLKKDIKPADHDADTVMKGLRAFTFNYKDEKHGKGKQLGVMAQDLEKSGLGHTVIDTPEGKMVHGGKLAASNTAMIAALGKRLSEVEKKAK